MPSNALLHIHSPYRTHRSVFPDFRCTQSCSSSESLASPQLSVRCLPRLVHKWPLALAPLVRNPDNLQQQQQRPRRPPRSSPLHEQRDASRPPHVRCHQPPPTPRPPSSPPPRPTRPSACIDVRCGCLDDISPPSPAHGARPARRA